MKFLIFGGSGFIGKALVNYLKEKNEEVKIVSRSAGKEGFAVDISNAADFEKIEFNPDVVINCASQLPEKGKTSQDPNFVQELFNTNVVGGLNIINWAVSLGIKKIINCSSLAVVRKPWPVPLTEEHSTVPEGSHVAYAMSKLSQEQLMNEAVTNTDTQLLHARLSAVYGDGMVPEGIIFKVMKDLRLEQNVHLANSKKNFIDLIHVRDVSQVLYNLSLVNTPNQAVVNVASGLPLSIYNLAKILKKIINSNSEVVDKQNSKPSSQANVSIQKLREYTGLNSENFIPLNEGLGELVENHKRNVKTGAL